MASLKILELSYPASAIHVGTATDPLVTTLTTETLEDADLLRLSAKGDEAAFTLLYRRHQGAVFRFLLHMSGRIDTAEEVTQEVFLMLIRHPNTYRPQRGSLQAFLIGVARNKLKRYRGDRYLASSGLDELSEAQGFSAFDPFGDCSRASELRALHCAILGLPRRYREVIVLCDLEEKQYSEVAHSLGCLVGTVRSRLHRARGLLAAKLRSREKCSI